MCHVLFGALKRERAPSVESGVHFAYVDLHPKAKFSVSKKKKERHTHPLLSSVNTPSVLPSPCHGHRAPHPDNVLQWVFSVFSVLHLPLSLRSGRLVP